MPNGTIILDFGPKKGQSGVVEKTFDYLLPVDKQQNFRPARPEAF